MNRCHAVSWPVFTFVGVGLTVCSFVLTLEARAVKQDPDRPPRVFVLNPQVLHLTRDAIRAGDDHFRESLRRLKKDADKALKAGPFSVTTKQQLPPSGSKHDYLSLGRYWWPDPAKPDGLPWIRRDGEVNPEALESSDHEQLSHMAGAVHCLAAGYYFVGSEAYARHAVELLRVWFLDTATSMNPNLDFSQTIRGRTEPRGPGVLDGRAFLLVIDAIGMMEGSAAWSAEMREGITRWFSEYLGWLRTSPNGRLESAAENNHGVWYDAQAAGIALFVGQDSTARRIVQEARTKRIGGQIEPDGSMPRELARTLSEHYTHFNLQAFVTLAQIAGRAGVDLWRYTTADGRGIRRVLENVLPVLRGEKPWQSRQIRPFDRAVYYPELLQAALEYPDMQLLPLADVLGGEKARSHRSNVLYGYGR